MEVCDYAMKYSNIMIPCEFMTGSMQEIFQAQTLYNKWTRTMHFSSSN